MVSVGGTGGEIVGEGDVVADGGGELQAASRSRAARRGVVLRIAVLYTKILPSWGFGTPTCCYRSHALARRSRRRPSRSTPGAKRKVRLQILRRDGAGSRAWYGARSTYRHPTLPPPSAEAGGEG